MMNGASAVDLAALRGAIARPIEESEAEIGVALRHVESGMEVLIDADARYPMASVFKIPILVEALARVGEGRQALDTRVGLRAEDRVPPSGVLVTLEPGLRPTLKDLLMLLMHPIRKGFDLFANVRPVKWYPGTEIPLKQNDPIDVVVVRENTEGEYAATGGRVHQGTADEVAIQTSVVSRRGTERIMRYAFELARRRNGKKYVHCVTKSNALSYTMVLWDEVFARVAAEYPDIRTAKSHVDAMSMYIITRPASFDVVVATNLMGDIISDEAACVCGSIGLAASANINPSRRTPALFEPIHGSAPDIAGRGIANPIGAILAAGMMLDWLGETKASRAVEAAVAMVLATGRVRTPDLAGHASTADMTDAILAGLPPPPPSGSRQTGGTY